MQDAATAWPDQIWELLKRHGIRQVALVPDAGHTRLIRRCIADNAVQVVTLTTEEEGIACSPALARRRQGRAADAKPGVGNCINMLSQPLLHRHDLPRLPSAQTSIPNAFRDSLQHWDLFQYVWYFHEIPRTW